MQAVTKILTAIGPGYRSDEGSLIRVLANAWGTKLDESIADGDAATAQFSILTASVRWLDQWGALYAIARKAQEADDAYADRLMRLSRNGVERKRRKAQEADDAYADRLISETIRQRPQPFALEQIVRYTYTIDEIFVRDLWPFILLSDQWVSPADKPLQVSDGQLDPTFFTFGPSMVTVSFSTMHTPGSFGIWIAETTSQLLTYTLQEVINLLPLVLLSDQISSTTHVSDGQVTTPDFGGPSDTARHSFSLPPPVFPVSINAILALINQHRAAGTRPIIMGTQLQPVPA